MSEKWAVAKAAATSCAAIANKSVHTRARGTPRGCRRASRTARAGGETDSTRQMCAPRPTATGPSHSHVRCDAWPARARCASPKTAPNGGRVVGAITEHTVRPLPRSPPMAVQRGDRIHQRQGFLRVVTVRTSQANRERHASSVANEVTRAPVPWRGRWDSVRSGHCGGRRG